MKRLLRTLSLSVCLLALLAPAAGAASKAPVIKTVSPKNLKIGDKMVITGSNFLPGKGKNRVYFLRGRGRFAWAPADSASARRIVVTVPDTLVEHLQRDGSSFAPTRFKVRVLAKKLGKATAIVRSPLISAADGTLTDPTGTPPTTNVPAGDCDGDGQTNGVETDDDNDLLVDTTEEATTKTDPCKIDTDGDAIEDGYEYQSALDLNNNPRYALPYPGKRPYPNPLDSTDAPTDYDGDGLTLQDEFRLWITFGGHTFPLNYSDGTQTSQPESKADYVSRDPAGVGATLLNFYIDINDDGNLSDDERDADGDGLTNWDESHGRMVQSWWDSWFDGKPCRPKETRYPLNYAPVDLTDPDSDGDSAKDGVDDQDHDGLVNAFEVNRPVDFMFSCDVWETDYISYGHPGTNAWARVQPFNPCKPVDSPTCHKYAPFGYYEDNEDVFSPPAPGPTPATPNG